MVPGVLDFFVDITALVSDVLNLGGDVGILVLDVHGLGVDIGDLGRCTGLGRGQRVGLGDRMV